MNIKFRGQSKNGKWHYGYLWKSPDGIWWIKDFKNLEDNQVKKETIGQFTGRLDKNKQEIYAGHIIKFEHSTGEKSIREIKFKKNNCSFCFGGSNFGLPEDWENNFEVIGNIYENKNLLIKK